MKTLFNITLVIILFISCSNKGFKRIKKYPEKPIDCAIDVYTNVLDADKKYEIICILYFKTDSEVRSGITFDAIEKLMPKACMCGGDAVLIPVTDEQGMLKDGWVGNTVAIKVLKYIY